MIPKIIHQTAPTKNLTSEECRVIRKNKTLLSGWDFRFYDDADNLRVMQEAFPEFYNQYSAIKRGVVQADIIRCVYLYCYGGWYFDTDYRVIRLFDGNVIQDNLTIDSQADGEVDLIAQKIILPISGIPGRDRHLVCNSIMASEKGHPFWRAFIEHLFSNDNLFDLPENSVEQLTGPLGLSNFYINNKDSFSDICLPKKEYFHPQITHFGFYFKKHPENYGVHWCWGSWRSKSFFRKAKNLITRKVTSFL